MQITLELILLFTIVALLVGILVLAIINKLDTNKASTEVSGLDKTLDSSVNKVLYGIESLNKINTNNFNNVFNRIDNLSNLDEQQNENLRRNLINSLNSFENSQETKLENLRVNMNENIKNMQESNELKLNQIRQTVDEKLTEHLESTLSRSFETVSKQLEAVYKSMGEMQTLANGVGDLKKVLSNTKTRGILGEFQLSGILKEILPEQQYEENVATVPGSTERVEFAIKFPSSENETVLLPIDAKFPAETYLHLQDAYESGDKELIDACKKELVIRLKNEAKDIRNKYIQIPDTTEFGIMFLPTEGLYAEACNLGMMETLQRDYHVTIAGPSTMAALLNSFQMGFRTLAIQKRSNEVWNILGKTKTEFGKFEDTLSTVQKNLRMTNDKLEELVGTRTRAINRTLKGIDSGLIDKENTFLLEDSDYN